MTPADGPKVNISARVRKSLVDAIQPIAREKEWSESQTIDRLLGWAISQLEIAGSFDALMKSNIARDPRSAAKEGMQRLREAQTNIHPDKSSQEKKKAG